MLNKKLCLNCAKRKDDDSALFNTQKILLQYGRCHCIKQNQSIYEPLTVAYINNDIITSFVFWLLVTLSLPFIIYSSWTILIFFILFQCVTLMMTVCVYNDIKQLEEISVSIQSEPPEKCPYLLEHTISK